MQAVLKALAAVYPARWHPCLHACCSVPAVQQAGSGLAGVPYLLGLDLAVLHVHLVAAQHDGDVLAHAARAEDGVGGG